MIIKRQWVAFSVVICLAIVSAGCASRAAYYTSLTSLMKNGKYTDAASYTETQRDKSYGKKNALLFFLDRGMLLQCAGQYSESNQAFERAKQLSDQLFTKSVTTEASTLLINDGMRPYYGEDFERALINIFCALNYVMLGKESEALVEARQVDLFLKTLETKYGHKNVYSKDAFARYLMGMLYENQGKVNDAFISYRLALDSYNSYLKMYAVPIPQDLVKDALRTAERLGFDDEVTEIKRKWPKVSYKKADGQTGELTVIHYAGFAPEKIDTFIEIAFGRAWGYVNSVSVRGKEEADVEKAGAIARSILSSDQVRVAFPKYETVPSSIQSCSLQAEGMRPDKSELGENIAAIAIKNLDDRITRVRIRAIARAAIKYSLANAVSKKVEKNSGDKVLGWLTKKVLTVAATATENADKRCWRSLPERINVARMDLPVGTHTVTVEFYNSEGDIVSSRILRDVKIKARKKTFEIVRTVL